MKYQPQKVRMDLEQRKSLNEKVLYLIDSGTATEAGITSEDIYNAYTGDGGLHGLERRDFNDYYHLQQVMIFSKERVMKKSKRFSRRPQTSSLNISQKKRLYLPWCIWTRKRPICTFLLSR